MANPVGGVRQVKFTDDVQLVIWIWSGTKSWRRHSVRGHVLAEHLNYSFLKTDIVAFVVDEAAQLLFCCSIPINIKVPHLLHALITCAPHGHVKGAGTRRHLLDPNSFRVLTHARSHIRDAFFFQLAYAQIGLYTACTMSRSSSANETSVRYEIPSCSPGLVKKKKDTRAT